MGAAAASRPRIRLAVFGRPSLEALADIGHHSERLIQSLSDWIAGENAIDWRVSEWEIRCDMCGFSLPFAAYPGWTNDGHYDLCDACSVEVCS
jgi:hypothetical protein